MLSSLGGNVLILKEVAGFSQLAQARDPHYYGHRIRPEYANKYGTAPPRQLNYAGGQLAEISDDTQMTMFVAEGMIRAHQRFQDRGICNPVVVLAHALLRWYETQDESFEHPISQRGWLVEQKSLHARRVPGNTCLAALSSLKKRICGGSPSREFPSIQNPPNDSKGCGAVMRAAPIGLGATSSEMAFELGRDSSALTHGHPSGYLSAAYLAALVWYLARGYSLPDAMNQTDPELGKAKGNEELITILAKVKTLAAVGSPDRTTIESLGGGWTGEEALAIALFCALTADLTTADGVKQALWKAAAHSGDSDSTAAIAGNLIGTIVGSSGLPQDWLGQLEMLDLIEEVATDLHQAARKGKRLDSDKYPPN